MNEKKERGDWGEDRAVHYLRLHGYKILGRNFRCRQGEIDIIAKKGEFVAFVEVKQRKNADFGQAREFVTVSKQRRVIAAALSDNSLVLGQDELRTDDCVVIGNEGHGVSAETLAVSDAVVRIPMAPGTESLNAAGAAAVLMWEYYKTFG